MEHVCCFRFPSDGRVGDHQLKRYLHCIWRRWRISMPTTRRSSSGAPCDAAHESTPGKGQGVPAERSSESSPRQHLRWGSGYTARVHDPERAEVCDNTRDGKYLLFPSTSYAGILFGSGLACSSGIHRQETKCSSSTDAYG